PSATRLAARIRLPVIRTIRSPSCTSRATSMARAARKRRIIWSATYSDRPRREIISSASWKTAMQPDAHSAAQPEVSTSEHIVAAIVSEIDDGDVLLEGIGTFLPTSAYMLAQATHAPHAVRLCPVGNIFVAEAHRLSM